MFLCCAVSLLLLMRTCRGCSIDELLLLEATLFQGVFAAHRVQLAQLPSPWLQGRTPSDNLYIRGLPASWTNDDLANLFAAYGGVAVGSCQHCLTCSQPAQSLM